MNFKGKVLEAIKSICCPFIVGTFYRYFAHELERLASKSFMVKNITFIFIVIAVGFGVVRLAAEYTWFFYFTLAILKKEQNLEPTKL